ncbi:MAG TPA: hypothetical protein VMB46_09025 [Methanomassiliicoccales archaeon]|nr:hypothetical protein [Methanomassiliicoccales archaeon]
MSREEALALVRANVQKENNVKHMIAVGAAMKGLASRLGEDQGLWEDVGILHDIDFEKCHGAEDHTLVAKDMLDGKVSAEVIEAILAHNSEHTHVPVDTKLKKGLVCCDAASGLVIATALVLPTKKLADVKPSSIAKRFKEKDFARSVSRERIMVCTELGIPLEEFLAVALEGMKGAAVELGL